MADGDQVAGAKVLPIRAYILTREQDRVLHRAIQGIANACMKKQGFDVGLPDLYEPKVNGQTYDFFDRRYAAVNDEKTARQYGLHVPVYVEHPGPPPDAEMSDEAREALFGALGSGHSREEVDVSQGRLSYGGCLGEAEAALAKDMKYVSIGGEYAGPVRILSLDHTPEEDPRVIAAQAAWSSCVAEAGYKLKSTLDDESTVPGVDPTTPLPSRAEIELAVREVKCQERTKVVDIAFAVEAEYETKKIDEQAEVFAEIRKENEQLIQRAADLLGEEVP